MAKTKEEIAVRKKEWAANNKERIKGQAKAYYELNRDYLLFKNKEWAANNKDRARELGREKDRRNREAISPAYAAKILGIQGFTAEQRTPELIELKRITLKTERLCRQLKN